MSDTISLAMIVRDEEKNLSVCLESVQQEVDEIVVVDTGSRDRTLEIAKHYTDKVFQIVWEDDFSAARNFAKNQCSGQWILSLDADERLCCQTGSLRDLLSGRQGCELFFLPLECQSAHSAYGQDRFIVLRLFRNCADYYFSGKIHEQVMIANPAAVRYSAAPVIVHTAVSTRSRNGKRHRNLVLLHRVLREEPGNLFLRYYLGVEWFGLRRYDKALPLFQKVLTGLPDEHILFRAPALRHLLGCLSALGRSKEALLLCEQESARYPEYTDLFFDGGVLAEICGDYNTAIAWFRKAMAHGQPPPVFSHTDGTEGYLALYHLGCCCERLAGFAQAEHCYRQALETNPGFIAPLYHLFRLQLTGLPVRDVYGYVCTAGYLQREDWCGLLAELFFQVGAPDLAVRCVQEGAAEPGAAQAKYWLYCGRIDEALALFHAESPRESVVSGLVIDQFVTFLLKGDRQAARQLALRYWQMPMQRGAVLALLNLVSLYGLRPQRYYPEQSQQDAFIGTVLAVVDNCLRYHEQPAMIPLGVWYRRLAEHGLTLLSTLSAKGREAVADYWSAKADGVLRTLHDRNFLAGGFYL